MIPEANNCWINMETLRGRWLIDFGADERIWLIEGRGRLFAIFLFCGEESASCFYGLDSSL
jgi:hypothetical protein